MPNMLSSGDLIASIQTDLADNNAGLISAQDVRHNMEDTAFSINRIVASGDTNTVFPFFQNVRAKKTGSNYGRFIPESGIEFPNSPVNNTEVQVQPFLGVGRLDHNALDNLTVANPHTQYYKTDGTNACTDDFKLGNNWINASGTSNVGFKFVPTDGLAVAGGGPAQEIYVSGKMRWGDNSTMENGKGLAKAWAFFDASGANNKPQIFSYHNIHSIARKAQGKLKVTFTSGTFGDNNYVAIGTANGTSSSGSLEDFEVNSVGLIARSGDDGTHLRSVTFAIKDENGQYIDSQVCSITCYGYGPSESSGVPSPLVLDETTAPTF